MKKNLGTWDPGQLLLGDFHLERKLGEGGMGAVYLVRSRSTGERFAVKKTHLGDPSTETAFLAELWRGPYVDGGGGMGGRLGLSRGMGPWLFSCSCTRSRSMTARRLAWPQVSTRRCNITAASLSSPLR